MQAVSSCFYSALQFSRSLFSCSTSQSALCDKQTKMQRQSIFLGLWSFSQGKCLIMINGESNCNLLCAISCGFWTLSQISFIYSIHFVITHSFHELWNKMQSINIHSGKKCWLISWLGIELPITMIRTT